jgi:hypothetical protein
MKGIRSTAFHHRGVSTEVPANHRSLSLAAQHLPFSQPNSISSRPHSPLDASPSVSVGPPNARDLKSFILVEYNIAYLNCSYTTRPTSRRTSRFSEFLQKLTQVLYLCIPGHLITTVVELPRRAMKGKIFSSYSNNELIQVIEACREHAHDKVHSLFQ